MADEQTPAETTETATTTETVKNPDAVLAKNKELLGELAKTKAEQKALADRLAAFEAKEAKAEQEHLEKKGEFDKIIEGKERLWNEKYQAIESDRNEVLGGFIRKELELKYLQQYQGREGYSDLAVERIINQVEAVRKDGKLDIKVKDGIDDATDFDRVFGKLKDQYPALFKSDIASGSGASGSGKGGGQQIAKQMTKAQVAGLDAAAKREFYLNGGEVIDAR